MELEIPAQGPGSSENSAESAAMQSCFFPGITKKAESTGTPDDTLADFR
jgi:hypothetical protein